MDELTELQIEQAATLASPRMKPIPPARALFAVMDLLYGRSATLAKFRVLEVVARVPYIAWEQVAYVAITHTHGTPHFAHQIHDEVQAVREQQDNELYHLLILEELLQGRGERQGLWRYRVMPQLLAWLYYHVSWALYVVRPKWSYLLNVHFEDHAEHEYMAYVDEHPELEQQAWESEFEDDYGSHKTVADLLRRIGLDEREHKLDSLDKVHNARFGRWAKKR